MLRVAIGTLAAVTLGYAIWLYPVSPRFVVPREESAGLRSMQFDAAGTTLALYYFQNEESTAPVPPNGATIGPVGATTLVCLYDLATGRKRDRITVEGNSEVLALTHDRIALLASSTVQYHGTGTFTVDLKALDKTEYAANGTFYDTAHQLRTVIIGDFGQEKKDGPLIYVNYPNPPFGPDLHGRMICRFADKITAIDVVSGRELANFPLPREVAGEHGIFQHMQVSTNNQVLVARLASESCWIWASPETPPKPLPGISPRGTMDLSADGSWMVCTNENQLNSYSLIEELLFWFTESNRGGNDRIRIVHLPDGESAKTLAGDYGRFAPAGHSLVVARSDGSVAVWDVPVPIHQSWWRIGISAGVAFVLGCLIPRRRTE